MGLLDRLFGRRVVYAWNPGAYGGTTAFDKQAYEHEVVRGIIDTIATHAAKADAMHVVVDENNRVKEIKHDSPYSRLLNHRANGIMTGYDLKYRLFSQREQYTTAFCYVRWEGGKPDALLPVDYVNVEIRPVDNGSYACLFSLRDGKRLALPIEDVVILRKLFGNGEVMGDGNRPVENTLTMLKNADAGNMEALSVSNKVRGLLKQKKAMLSDDDVKKSTELFAARFQAAAKNGGIVGIDSMEEYTQLKADVLTMNSPLIKEIKSNLYRYWHVCESVLMGDYSDAQFQAFFDSAVEPGLIQAGQAFTGALFTPREYALGNRMMFNTSMLMHASVQTKIKIVSEARETGLLTINEQRELFGYAPIEGGDERQVSLNYIKAGQQGKYQTGEDEADEQE